MNSKTLFLVALSISTVFSIGNAFAEVKSPEFRACLKRTEHDRATCQSGCGMILQQCYDEADDALAKNVDALLAKPRSAACSGLAKKYADGSDQLASATVSDADLQSGWLGAELKWQLLQQRFEAVRLIDKMCK